MNKRIELDGKVRGKRMIGRRGIDWEEEEEEEED